MFQRSEDIFINLKEKTGTRIVEYRCGSHFTNDNYVCHLRVNYEN